MAAVRVGASMNEQSKHSTDSRVPGRLILSYADVQRELETFKPVARHYLDDKSVTNLYEGWLRRILDSADVRTGDTCKVKTTSSLRTRPNDGLHQRSSGIILLGELDFTWDVVPFRDKARKAAAKQFGLDNSSMRLKLLRVGENDDRELVAQWTFDIGNAESPGCHFHAKHENIHASTSNIDIPRLPTLVTMPTDAMAFIFGELWQKQWADELLSGLQTSADRWRPWPQRRLCAVLSSLTKCVADGNRLVPWAVLKAFKPRPDLLLPR